MRGHPMLAAYQYDLRCKIARIVWGNGPISEARLHLAPHQRLNRPAPITSRASVQTALLVSRLVLGSKLLHSALQRLDKLMPASQTLTMLQCFQKQVQRTIVFLTAERRHSQVRGGSPRPVSPDHRAVASILRPRHTSCSSSGSSSTSTSSSSSSRSSSDCIPASKVAACALSDGSRVAIRASESFLASRRQAELAQPPLDHLKQLGALVHMLILLFRLRHPGVSNMTSDEFYSEGDALHSAEAAGGLRKGSTSGDRGGAAAYAGDFQRRDEDTHLLNISPVLTASCAEAAVDVELTGTSATQSQERSAAVGQQRLGCSYGSMELNRALIAIDRHEWTDGNTLERTDPFEWNDSHDTPKMLAAIALPS